MARRPKPKGLVFHEPTKVALDAVRFAPYNPRTIDAEQMASLKASLLEHGVVLHLVVQRKADDGTPMVLIAGHQRVRAAREVCEEHGWPMPSSAWAVVLDVDDRKAKRLNVALNKIDGEFDAFMLGRLFADVAPDMSFDEAVATGFQPGEIDELIHLALDPDAQADALESSMGLLDGFGRSVTLTVEFDTVERRDQVKETLKRMSKQRGCKPGVLIEEAVRVLLAKVPRRRGKRRAAAGG